jgi:hypothetical protein
MRGGEEGTCTSRRYARMSAWMGRAGVEGVGWLVGWGLGGGGPTHTAHTYGHNSPLVARLLEALVYRKLHCTVAGEQQRRDEALVQAPHALRADNGLHRVHSALVTAARVQGHTCARPLRAPQPCGMHNCMRTHTLQWGAARLENDTGC